MVLLADLHEFAGQASADEEAVVVPTDVAAGGDATQRGMRWIGELWKGRGPGTRAGLPVGQRGLIVQSLVGAQDVVDIGAPVGDIGSEVVQAIAADAWPNFALESAVESFELALGLRMVRSPMAGTDA